MFKLLRAAVLFDVEKDRQSGAQGIFSELLLDAQQNQARRADLLRLDPVEELEDSEGEEAAVQVLDGLVQVRKRERDSGGHAVHLGDEGEFRFEQELKILRR